MLEKGLRIGYDDLSFRFRVGQVVDCLGSEQHVRWVQHLEIKWPAEAVGQQAHLFIGQQGRDRILNIGSLLFVSSDHQVIDTGMAVGIRNTATLDAAGQAVAV